jgi:hypothetical protein
MSKKNLMASIGQRSYAPPKGFQGRVIKLHDIAKSRLTYEFETPQTASQIKFIANNPTDAPIGLDLTGGFVFPSNNSFQRLLIAGARGAMDGVAVIAPGQTVTLKLMTACMDQTKKPPDGKIKYTLSSKPAPEAFQQVAKRFANQACLGSSWQPMAQSRATQELVGDPAGSFQNETWAVGQDK